MSSSAAAPSRIADADQHYGDHPLQEEIDPKTVQDLDAPEVEPAANTQSLDEINRLQHLLSQMEAHSLALVPYGYGHLRETGPRKSNTGLLVGALAAVWLSSLVLAVAYIRYVSPSTSLTAHAAGTVPLTITPDSDSSDQKVAKSVDHLAQALVASSERLNQVQAAMERSNRDLQKISAKVNSEPAKPVSALPSTPSADTEDSKAPQQVTLPKNWHQVIEVKPTESAVPHKASDGSIDYWLVPHGTDQPPSKVLPIGTSPEGVIVHSLDDGKDYTLTSSGEWRNGTIAPAAQ